jgi:hypothetical protein
MLKDRAIAQAIWSLASHRGGPGSRPRLVKWDLWWAKWRWARLSPSTSVSPASLHSTKFAIVTITRDRYNRPEVADVPRGPSMDSTTHYSNLKQKGYEGVLCNTKECMYLRIIIVLVKSRNIGS